MQNIKQYYYSDGQFFIRPMLRYSKTIKQCKGIMQNSLNRLILNHDSSGYQLYQGRPTRSSLIHGLQYQGKLTSLTFQERKLSNQKLNFRD